MGKSTIKPVAKLTALKQKQDWPPNNNTNKRAKKNLAVFGFYYILAFFKMWVIHALKSLAWKSHNLLTNTTTKISID